MPPGPGQAEAQQALQSGGAIHENTEWATETAELQESDVFREAVAVQSAAVALVQQWTAPNRAAQLSSRGGALSLLRLVSALGRLQWHGNELSASSCLVLGEMFVDALAQTVRSAAASPAPAPSQSRQVAGGMSAAELKQASMLWLSRFRSSKVIAGGEGAGGVDEVRYWWARGRLHEAATEAARAIACLRNCDAVLAGLRVGAILVPHCQLDCDITAAAIEGKLEVLQLYEVLAEANKLASEGDYAQAAEKLGPVLLTGCAREALMASVDRKTWLRALHALLHLAGHTGDHLLALRCHVRLLGAGLPSVPHHIQTMMRQGELYNTS